MLQAQGVGEKKEVTQDPIELMLMMQEEQKLRLKQSAIGKLFVAEVHDKAKFCLAILTSVYSLCFVAVEVICVSIVKCSSRGFSSRTGRRADCRSSTNSGGGRGRPPQDVPQREEEASEETEEVGGEEAKEGKER